MTDLGKRLTRLRKQREALAQALTSLTDTGIEMWMILQILEEDARSGAPGPLAKDLFKVHRKRIEKFVEGCEKLKRQYPAVNLDGLLAQP